MPNSIAFFALLAWPLVMLFLFRRLPLGRAVIWSFLGAYLLLPPFPAAIDLPLMPPLNKDTLPNVVALFLVVFMAGQKVTLLPQTPMGKILMLVFVFSPILTVITNPEPILFATSGLRGLYAMDMLALIINQAMVLISFNLARILLRTKEDLRDILIAFVISGVIYAFPMLLEIRLSPQLNLWIYGYFQHMFEQMVRGDGFRSIVFLSHGIWAAMLAMVTFSSAIILMRQSDSKNRPWFLVAGVFMFGVLVLSKTLGPFLYAIVMLLFVGLSAWRMQLRVAVVLAALTIAYPVVKSLDLVPEKQVVALAGQASDDRAGSLKFRLDNERILLDRANEKPVFGWGTWGRNHVHNPITGEILSVSDGRWVVTIGVFGWVGLLAEFGLLSLPIFLLWREVIALERKKRPGSATSSLASIRRYPEPQKAPYHPSPLAGAIALLLALNMVDLLPNATLSPLTWLLTGALLGYAESVRARRLVAEGSINEPTTSGPVSSGQKRARTIL
ncbi:hypothetical protein NBRC116601_03610 [Cognatishimia sp. WU-CL00825]|uniref:hypothetical protein n=1 Tax=Cognatishimia sp. WU-CL00825 TaxID=3127658 RepID=UPI00310850E0